MSTQIENHVADLLKNVYSQFIEDKKIMDGFAKQHHTTVEVGDIFDVLRKPGVYHVLLPFKLAKDAERLLSAPGLSEWCGDNRQAVEVANALGVNDNMNAKFVQAGGGSQILDRRQKALASVERAYLKHNSNGKIRKVVHSGFCGRNIKDAAEYAGNPSAFYDVVTRGGASRDDQPELDLLHDLLDNALYNLVREDWPDVPKREDRERVQFFIAHVDGPEHGSFKGVEVIK